MVKNPEPIYEFDLDFEKHQRGSDVVQVSLRIVPERSGVVLGPNVVAGPGTFAQDAPIHADLYLVSRKALRKKLQEWIQKLDSLK